MGNKIAEGWDICKKHAPTPRRFKLTIVTGDVRFNHVVEAGTMFLQNRRGPLPRQTSDSFMISWIPKISIRALYMEMLTVPVDSHLGRPAILPLSRPRMSVHIAINAPKCGSGRHKFKVTANLNTGSDRAIAVKCELHLTRRKVRSPGLICWWEEMGDSTRGYLWVRVL